jgi:uncharacterized lipoprotein YmbA
MNMTKTRILMACVLSLPLLIMGCGTSPANNYYLLSAYDFNAPGGASPSVGVGPIEIPEYLSRESMIYQRNGNTLQLASLDLWAEPLSDGVQRVLVLNLAGLLDTQDIRFFPWHPKRAPQFGVKVNLLQLEVVEQQALLTAEWLVYRPDNSAAVGQRISRLQSPLPAGATTGEQVAAAYSDLLLQLSKVIADTISSDQIARSEAAEP